MQVATRMIRRSPDACWRVLVDPTTMTGWIPGLQRARVIATYPTRLAREIDFEFQSSLAYRLTYAYDIAASKMSWSSPRGRGVRGYAILEPTTDGTKLTYAAATGGYDVEALVAEFATWMHAY
jgi:hypothetical protein